MLEVGGEICGSTELNVLRLLAIDRRFPARQRTFIHWCIVGERGVRNFRDYFAVFEHAHGRVVGDAADLDGVESPLLKDAENFFFTTLLCDQQHALLRFAEHDLVGSNTRFALWHAVEFDFDSGAAARAHLAGRASQPGRAHILNANDGAGLHGFQTGFEQQFFEERISDLNIRALGFRAFAELLARHGGTVDAVASGFRADINYGIALPGCASVKNLVAANQAQSERVDQRIAGVARLELHFAAEVGDAETISVGRYAGDYALHDGVVLVDLG